MESNKDTGRSVHKGLGGITSGIGRGVQGIGNAVGSQTERKSRSKDKDSKSHRKHTDATDKVNNGGTTATDKVGSGSTTTTSAAPAPGIVPGISTAIFAPLTSVAAVSQDTVKGGLAIGQSVLKAGLDTSSNVVTGTASMGGTALGAVISAAAETSGAVFEPVISGLRTIEGLESVGKGVEAINGLSVGAVKQVGQFTMNAINMSGKTPTFFDPNADGIVKVHDTIRGLILLGLDDKNAKYAAYALHVCFSYSTCESWLPACGFELPIRTARMGRTSWGRNWGTYERVDWVDDVEIDKFFVDDKDKRTWSDKVKKARQAFGVLLLIFEWGTTWPFYMPDLPIQSIPFSDDIGKVVRKAILPTIISNFKKAKGAEAEADKKNKHPKT